MDSQLNDERNGVHDPFAGATLKIGAEDGSVPQVGFSDVGVTRSDSLPSSATGISRNDRGGSAIGRRSNLSTGSRTSPSQTAVITDMAKDMFFSKKPGTFERAVEWCQGNVVKGDIDGQVRGAWLLGEVDHWDHEKEKMLLLTDHSLLIVRYDFITTKLKNYKRIMLRLIHTMIVGDFVYPEKSLMGKFRVRDHGGVRLIWGDLAALSFGQKWNPFATDIPSTTFIHHPLIYNPKETETVTFNVDDFCDSIEQAVRRELKTIAPEDQLQVRNEPIIQESYASVSSLIFNQSHLGFNKDRNGVSF